jgi:protein TonB
LSAYRIPSAYDRPPLQRRASGLALALGVNVLLLLVLMTLGIIPPIVTKPSQATIVDLIPESHSATAAPEKAVVPRRSTRASKKRLPKPPPIVLPSKPTITPSPKSSPWIEMSKDEMAAADIRNLPKAGSGTAGDSEEVGRGPHGEVLYAADWLREPTRAEIAGYWPANAPSGWGMVACKTIAGDRVNDCIEIDQSPHGSHFASAVRQMAWQFRVKPPRKGGHALIGSWVRILIEIDQTTKDD